jgi:hypothetical protein
LLMDRELNIIGANDAYRKSTRRGDGNSTGVRPPKRKTGV